MACSSEGPRREFIGRVGGVAAHRLAESRENAAAIPRMLNNDLRSVALQRDQRSFYLKRPGLLWIFFLACADAWEDYYITFRASRNLATGHGLVFNVGDRLQTFTSPIGALLLALSSLLRATDRRRPHSGSIARYAFPHSVWRPLCCSLRPCGCVTPPSRASHWWVGS